MKNVGKQMPEPSNIQSREAPGLQSPGSNSHVQATTDLCEVQICIECSHPTRLGRWRNIPGGKNLLARIDEKISTGCLQERVTLRPVACLGNCKRRCRLSITGYKRWTWALGDADPAKDADAIIDVIRAWLASSSGLIAKQYRSPWLVKNTLARVPPVRRR